MTPATPEIPPSVAVSPDDQSSDRTQSDSDQAVTVGKLDQLIASNNQLTEASTDLGLAVVEAQREVLVAHRQYTVKLRLLAASLIATLVGVAVIIAALVVAQKSRNELADCIKPAGRCYQQNQQRTAELIGNLNKVTELAAACAPDYTLLPFPQREQAIQACIVRGLAK